MTESLPTSAPHNASVSHQTRALLIVNPASRSGDETRIGELVQRLREGGIEVIRMDSDSAEDTRQAIEQHHESIDLVILGGGDGTIHSSVTAIHQHGLTLAILPLGTGNDLARSLGLPLNVDQALDVIIAGHRRQMDLAKVNGSLFFNALNIGLGVRITHELDPQAKKSWGVFSYLKAMLDALTKHHSFKAEIAIDGKMHRMRTMQIAVGNGRFYGGGNVIDEMAAIDDGRLHIYALRPHGFWELLLLLPLMRHGRQVDGIHFLQASGSSICISASSRLEVHADGEPTTHTPAEIEVLPGALQVVAIDGPLPGHELQPQDAQGAS